MRTMHNPTILVSGATDGLGKRVARDLAERGATVLLHGRDPRKGEAALRKILDATDIKTLKYYNADFASLEDVRRLAAAVQDRIRARSAKRVRMAMSYASP